MVARGADLSEAVTALSARLWDLKIHVQPTVLSVLAKTLSQADFASLVQDVITALNSKDRERRRQAADILLAWVGYKGHNREREKVAPQQAYVALAQAFLHKDNVLRKMCLRQVLLLCLASSKLCRSSANSLASLRWHQ